MPHSPLRPVRPQAHARRTVAAAIAGGVLLTLTAPVGLSAPAGAVGLHAQSAASLVPVAKKKKKKKKKVHRPGPTTATATGVSGGIRISWRGVRYANRYRAKWAPSAWDTWPGGPFYVYGENGKSWLPGALRSAIHRVPTDAAHDSTMTAVPYGNPVFAQVLTGNSLKPKAHAARSKWVHAWPTLPTPAAGDPVRFGTYNLLLASDLPSRMPVEAKNIADHHLDIVALQEVGAYADEMAADVSRASGRTWAVADDSTSSEMHIIYDTAKFRVLGSGLLNDESGGTAIVNHKTGATLSTPWALLAPVASSTWSQPFLVVSAHFVPHLAADGTHQAANNRDTGQNATAVLSKIAILAKRLDLGADPVIIAGDFTSNNEVHGDAHPAQPTIVRAGYYDAMASLSRTGVAYSTVNKRAHESASPSGVGGRPDSIFLKGIQGSVSYVNVANWYGGQAKPPSDHNLVYADIRVPQAG